MGGFFFQLLSIAKVRAWAVYGVVLHRMWAWLTSQCHIWIKIECPHIFEDNIQRSLEEKIDNFQIWLLSRINKTLQKFPIMFLNPLHPNISIDFLHTVLRIF